MSQTEQLPTKDITIQKNIFTIPQPYAEGHTLTAIEAKQLNQTWGEGIRNNMAPKVKKAVEDTAGGDESAMKKVRAEVKAYAATYVFTSGGTGRTKMDPIEREARKIARSYIVQSLTKTGRKVSEVDKDKLATAIANVADSPKVMKEAKKRVEQAFSIADEELGELDI